MIEGNVTAIGPPSAMSRPGSSARICETDEPEKSCHLPYGIGFGEGKGEAWQIDAAHGGRGGVGIRNSLPWVAAVPPDMH